MNDQSQYVLASSQHLAMRGSLDGLSAGQVRGAINGVIKKIPGFYLSVNALPAIFTNAQKAHIKRDPLAFFEEYIQVNKTLIVRVVNNARGLVNYPKSVNIRDLTTGKHNSFSVAVNSRSSWAEVFIAIVAMANRYPGQTAVAVPRVLAKVAQETAKGWFGLGAAGADDAAAAGVGTVTLAGVAGIITAIALLAGEILPLVGQLAGGVTAPGQDTAAVVDDARQKRMEAIRRAQGKTPTHNTVQLAQQSKSKLPLILGGVALLGTLVIIKKKRG